MVYIWGFCPKLLWVTCSSRLLYFFLYLFWCGSCLGLTLVSFSITISTLSTRHGKTGGSDQVWVGSIGSRVKTGHGSKRVIFKRVIRVAGQTGRGLSRVELTCIFQNFFFFFEVDAICQLFMSSLTIIRFSLVILSPITTKHLTWYPNLEQLLFQLSRN